MKLGIALITWAVLMLASHSYALISLEGERDAFAIGYVLGRWLVVGGIPLAIGIWRLRKMKGG